MESLSRRDFLKLGGALALAAAASPAVRALAAMPAPSVFERGSTRQRQIAITFDDCDLAHLVVRLEDLLQNYPNTRITFFPVGKAIESDEKKYPGIWKRIHESGHEIGYHSFNHDNMLLFKTEKIIADFDHWREALGAALGFAPDVRFARPPYGNVNDNFLKMCQARGLVCTMWSWGWGGDNSADVVKNIVPKTRNGDIVLMHTRTVDVDTLTSTLPWLAENNLQAVTLRELYFDLQKELLNPSGCDKSSSPSLTRTCME